NRGCFGVPILAPELAASALLALARSLAEIPDSVLVDCLDGSACPTPSGYALASCCHRAGDLNILRPAFRCPYLCPLAAALARVARRHMASWRCVFAQPLV